MPFAGTSMMLLNMMFVVAPGMALYCLHTMAPSWSWCMSVLRTTAMLRDPYHGSWMRGIFELLF